MQASAMNIHCITMQVHIMSMEGIKITNEISPCVREMKATRQMSTFAISRTGYQRQSPSASKLQGRSSKLRYNRAC